MNDKKAKKFRKLAAYIAKGMPERQLLLHRRTRVIVNDPKSVRGVYRNLKNMARKGINYGPNSGRVEGPAGS